MNKSSSLKQGKTEWGIIYNFQRTSYDVKK